MDCSGPGTRRLSRRGDRRRQDAVGRTRLRIGEGIIGLVGAAHQSWSANLFTTVSDMFPRNTIGSLIGMGTMAGGIGSMLFQHVCGKVLDTSGAGHAQAGYFLLFAYAACAYLVAFGLQHLLAPKFEPLNLHAKSR